MLQVIAVATFLAFQPGAAQAERTDLCTLLNKLAGYSGRRITVRAEVILARESTFLMDDNCLSGPKANGYSWVPYVSWASPVQRTSLPDGYQLDKAAFSDFRQEVERARRRYRKIKVIATVSGFLTARSDLTALPGKNGQPIPQGFGHLTQFPAELLVESIKDWVITEDRTH